MNRTTGSTNRQTTKTGSGTRDAAARRRRYADETPEQRKARLERNRKRREQKEKQRKKEQRIRYAKIGAAVLATVILLIVGISLIRKAQGGGTRSTSGEEAAAVETMKATEVLHLSFPVLHLDPDANEEEAAAEEQEMLYDAYTGTWYYPEETEETESESAETTSETTESPLTVTEFNEILEELYNRDYVLVDIDSVAVTTSDGQIQASSVDVPVGKKPLIISQYNISYEPGFNGYADSVIVDASGNIICTYTDSIGDVRRGAVDVIPLVEKFIGSHPDFSYNGARGVLGVTGYNGIFGHAMKTDGSVVSSLTPEAIAAAKENMPVEYTFDAYGNYVEAEEAEEDAEEAPVVKELTQEDIEANIDICKDVVSVLKTNGWKIACGTYGYLSYASDLERVKADQEQWDAELAGIIGETDILMLPLKGDLDAWSGYKATNAKYTYLRDKGYRFFCVEEDEAPLFLQITPEYVRMGIHEITSWTKYREVTGKIF